VRLAVSANDAKVYNDNGVVRTVTNPPPDTVSIIDLTSSPPRIIADVEAPTSVTGAPLSVAVAPDESIALVTQSMRLDPKDPSKLVPGNQLSVIDLQATPPRVTQTLEAGLGASGVSFNRAGTLALVANRNDGTVSVFTVSGKTVTPAGRVKIGDEKSSPSHVVITPDGMRALVTRQGDSGITLLRIDGARVETTNRTFYAGQRPNAADITPDGAVVVVANIGRGQGDVDTVSAIDMRANPPRTVNTVSVGPTTEGIKLSPDGRWCAVVVVNGSNRATNHPLYNPHGKLVVLRLDGTQLTKVAETPIGGWSQGAVFSGDGRLILVQNMIEKNIQVFGFDGSSLRETAKIPLKGGGAAIRTAER
jgi:DNA-binding beta-propeller fold protein YncE